jgi:hypothetical protein
MGNIVRSHWVYGEDFPNNGPKRTWPKMWKIQCPWKIVTITSMIMSIASIFGTYKALRGIRRVFWPMYLHAPGWRYWAFQRRLRRRKLPRTFLKPIGKWGGWGFRWSVWDCIMVTVRGTEDGWNSILAMVFVKLPKRIRRRGPKKWRRWATGQVLFMAIFSWMNLFSETYVKYVSPVPENWASDDVPGIIDHPWNHFRRRIEKMAEENEGRYLPILASLRTAIGNNATIPPLERSVREEYTKYGRSASAIREELRGRHPAGYRPPVQRVFEDADLEALDEK